jgi:class 3 adenylate cyclase
MTPTRQNPKPKEIRATVFFVDIINSTGISGVQDPTSYNRMLTEYQSLMFDAITDHMQQYRYRARRELTGRGTDMRTGQDYEWDIEGDEASVFFYSDNPEYDVRAALQLAMKIKLVWLTSDFNYSAFEDKGLLFDVGIGLHTGKVIREAKDWRIRSREVIPRIDGFAINIGKKVEGFSRAGQMFKICVSGNVRSILEQNRNFAAKFSSDRQQKLRDSAITITVFEVVSFLDHEVFIYLPPNLKERTLKRMLELVQTAHLRRDLFWLYLLVMRYWLMDVTGKEDSRLAADRIIRLGAALMNFASQLSKQEQAYLRDYLSSVNNMVALAYTARDLESDRLFARKIFNATISKIDKQNVPARLHLAHYLLNAGDYKAAAKYCADIMMLDPGNPTAKAIIDKAAREAARAGVEATR